MADGILKLAEDLAAGYLGSATASRTASVLSSITGGIVAAQTDGREDLPEPPRLRIQAPAAEFPHRELAKVPVMVRLEVATTEDGETVLGTDFADAASWMHAVRTDLRDLSQWDTYVRTLDGSAWGLRMVTPVNLAGEAEQGGGDAMRQILTAAVLLTFVGASTGAASGDPLPASTVNANRVLLGTYAAAENIGSPRFVALNGSGLLIAADRSTPQEALGYIVSTVTIGNSVSVYDGGLISGLSGMTPGAVQFLSTGGLREETATATTGHVVQRVGKALSATTLAVDMEPGITLA